MNLDESLKTLPDGNGAIVILSGGLDSTIALRLAHRKYGEWKTVALSFNYNQKQNIELEYARKSTRALRVEHEIVDLSFLGEFSKGFSANVDPDIDMPTVKEIIGHPQPKTYVPNRNMIMLSIACSLAEVRSLDYVICGLQVHDLYSYWDTSLAFVDKMNDVISENRLHKTRIIAPFATLTKYDELKILQEMDGNIDFAEKTWTCYNPQNIANKYEDYPVWAACAKCPSCAERIQNFGRLKIEDPLPYAEAIDWQKVFDKCASS